MKLKSILVSILGAGLFLALAVVAPVSAEPVTVEFWHAMSGGLQDALVALTDEFNATNGQDITVELVNQGGYGDLSKKLMASVAADTLPDMAQVYNNWITGYLDSVVALDDLVATNFDNYDDILESYRNEGAEYGPIYTIGFNKSIQIFFYNKTQFAELGLEVPTTWEELEAAGKVALEATGKPIVGYDDLFGLFQQYVQQNGSGFVVDGKIEFNSPEGLEALTFILNLYKNGYARLAGEDVYLSGPFGNGDVLAYVGSSAGAAYIQPKDFEYGAAPLPKGPVKGSVPQAGTNLALFAQDAAKQTAAWEYIKFLTSADATVEWAIATGYLPVRTSGFESATYQAFMEENEVAQAAYAQVGDQYFEPVFNNSYDIRSLISTEIETAILEEKTPEDAMNTIVEKVQALLDN